MAEHSVCSRLKEPSAMRLLKTARSLGVTIEELLEDQLEDQ